MEVGYFLIFWYGILHAFGPDHLTVIADFSIGKSIKKSFGITLMFAFGHGMMLFIFAKLLQTSPYLETLSSYGDIISSLIIIAMGLYLLFMVFTHRIRLSRHYHNDKEHIHIWFGKEHSHNKPSLTASAWALGALMGMGGVRGMLVTLGLLHGTAVEWSMILAFVAGVSCVFLAFGAIIFFLNRYLLTSLDTLRRSFTFMGFVSVGVGLQMLISS